MKTFTVLTQDFITAETLLEELGLCLSSFDQTTGEDPKDFLKEELHTCKVESKPVPKAKEEKFTCAFKVSFKAKEEVETTFFFREFLQGLFHLGFSVPLR